MSERKPTNQAIRIVYLDRGGLPQRIQIPTPKGNISWINYDVSSQTEAVERAKDAQIIVTNKTPITEELLSNCPLVRHIAVTATGYNVVDLSACKRRGISISNVPSYAATTVSEHVIACALTLRRQIFDYRDRVIRGDWEKSSVFCLFGTPFEDLSGATLGLIGLGEIGASVATKAAALGMEVVFSSRSKRAHPNARQVELEYLLEQSDIVSIHCDLNDSTRGLINARALNTMKESAVLINTARGGIVNEASVVRALENGKLGGFATDVSEQEPPSETSVLMPIANKTNVIITPHIAWTSEQAMQYLANTVSKNIESFLAGNPLNLVTD